MIVPPSRGLFGLYSSNCPECGQNMGQKPQEHVCDEKQRIAHQSTLFAAEMRSRLEPELQDYLASPRGRFLMWLVNEKRI